MALPTETPDIITAHPDFLYTTRPGDGTVKYVFQTVQFNNLKDALVYAQTNPPVIPDAWAFLYSEDKGKTFNQYAIMSHELTLDHIRTVTMVSDNGGKFDLPNNDTLIYSKDRRAWKWVALHEPTWKPYQAKTFEQRTNTNFGNLGHGNY